MHIRQLFGLLIGGLFLALIIAIYNSRVINTTVLLQAGHEGRTRGNIGSVQGHLKEVDWNIKVTKLVEKELKRNHIDVTRVGASIPVANTRIAISVHFDGAKDPAQQGLLLGMISIISIQKIWQEIGNVNTKAIFLLNGIVTTLPKTYHTIMDLVGSIVKKGFWYWNWVKSPVKIRPTGYNQDWSLSLYVLPTLLWRS